MAEVYRFRSGQPISWFATRKRRSNQHCLYCGVFVGEGSVVPSNREHLIGRSFVPDGMLDATAFNFIFRACVACNSSKANAERHVSSVTLLTSRASVDDPLIEALAQRKGSKDYHPNRPGVPVKDALLHHTIKSTFGPLNVSVDIEGPPQLDTAHAVRLACHQVQALFSLVTTADPLITTQLLDPAHWQYLGIYPWRDWGNVQLVEVLRRVRDWPTYARIDTANGFFKAILRASDEPTEEWFWGIEWNQSHRIVGRLTREPLRSVFDDLPEHNWEQVSRTARMREEIPAPDADTFLPAIEE